MKLLIGIIENTQSHAEAAYMAAKEQKSHTSSDIFG